ncbi:MAG: type I DNA topoisomerase [Vampirovibrionales bacterium]
MPHLVIVESPAKATTINKYLGKDYDVVASVGHIRDLPAKNGSVDPNDNFRMEWELSPRAKGVVSDLSKRAKTADSIILATDPDREGEAISWHIYQVLAEKGIFKSGKPVQRVVFNEITKTAILEAMQNPRQIDEPLVHAYLARRALDYLVGFTLSPVLWRKLPGSRSAGRVQSVALRLICEREMEIERFIPQEYWSVRGFFQATPELKANLFKWHGKKLEKLSIANAQDAQEAKSTLESSQGFTVTSIESKTVQRHPAPPFITSTLQQEASRKLGFGVTRTMQTAQKLYEQGLITYMRTDGVNLSAEALGSIRNHILKTKGKAYLPEQPRAYKSKAKNAQEAHEAIRPTNVDTVPSILPITLTDDQRRLYDLIWKRTVACQMASAQLEASTVLIDNVEKTATLKATGSFLLFDGFLAVYQEGLDDSDDESNQHLPKLSLGQAITLNRAESEQHFTKAPPRFSEASLVKAMEELGIGRPSTYASIIRVLQERNYVRLDQRRFIPEDRGRLVTTFLSTYFPKYVEYDFTASLEDQLDDVTSGEIDYLKLLQDFWVPFLATVDSTKDLTITEVIDTLDATLSHHFFPFKEGQTPEEARKCPKCGEGRLGLKLGKFGAFLGCSVYPTCKYNKPLAEAVSDAKGDGEPSEVFEAKTLGQDPATGKDVTLQKGPYGYYVQLGEEEEIPPAANSRAKKPKKVKPRRSSLEVGMKPETTTFDVALRLLSLPRDIGTTADGLKVISNNGRFGPYIQVGPTFVSLKPPLNVYEITLDEAVAFYANSGKKALDLGEYKKKSITVNKGRYGYYLTYKRQKYALPKGTEPESVTLEQAIAIIDAKSSDTGSGKGSTKSTTKKASAKTKTVRSKKA